MTKQVLVPLDGSILAEAVVPHAVALALANGYGLTLLRVATKLDPIIPISSTGWSAAPVGNVWKEWDEELNFEKDYLEVLAERLRTKGLDVQTALVEDEAALGVISYAQKHPDVVMIAMSTHGRSGLSRWVFGSVSERVLHASPVPLLLVRPRHAEELPEDFQVPEYKSLLVPLDGSVFATQALYQAKTLASSMHTTLTLVLAVPEARVVGELVAPPALPVEGTDETEILTNYLQQNRKELEAEGFMVDARLESGPPAEAILRVVEAIHADLILMATHGRTGLQRMWLGSVAMKVVQASAHPVLLVRATERVKEAKPERADASVVPAFMI